jgi:hypothetical protein
MRRTWIIGLLILVFVGLVVLPAAAGRFGSWFASSVHFTGQFTGVGGKGDPNVNMLVEPLPGDDSVVGIIFCGNPGINNHIAPGVNPVEVDLMEFDVAKAYFKKGKLIIEDIGGEPQDLQSLVSGCPNPNWEVLTFIPLGFTGTITVALETGQDDTLTQVCNLPNPETYQYQEVRFYDCFDV